MSDIDAQPSPGEVELKLSIGSDSARDAADREVGAAPARSVETIYYDTPRRSLQLAGYSLRLRRDGERWSQSVKAAGGFSRFEQEQPLRGGLPDFSLLDGTPLASLIGVDGAPAPVFVTRVQRRSRKRDLDNSHIEMSFDEGEVIAHDRSWPILELELELKGGEPRALFDAGRRLAEDNAFVPDFMSKAERGFALADGMLGEPVRFGSYPLDPHLSAVEGFQVLARRCLRQLSLNAELIAGGAQLEATHQARTALRRLRVAIRLFEKFLDPTKAGKVKDEAPAGLTGELGPARNLDVTIRGDLPASGARDRGPQLGGGRWPCVARGPGTGARPRPSGPRSAEVQAAAAGFRPLGRDRLARRDCRSRSRPPDRRLRPDRPGASPAQPGPAAEEA